MTAYIEKLCYLTCFQVKDVSYHLFFKSGSKALPSEVEGTSIEEPGFMRLLYFTWSHYFERLRNFRQE